MKYYTDDLVLLALSWTAWLPARSGVDADENYFSCTFRSRIKMDRKQ